MYLNPPICLYGVVFNYMVKYRDIFSFLAGSGYEKVDSHLLHEVCVFSKHSLLTINKEQIIFTSRRGPVTCHWSNNYPHSEELTRRKGRPSAAFEVSKVNAASVEHVRRTFHTIAAPS
jgi:hypothetical protein